MQNPLRSPAAEGASNFPGWKAVFIFLVLYAAAYLDRQVLTLLVDPIRKDLHCTDFQISLLQGLGHQSKLLEDIRPDQQKHGRGATHTRRTRRSGNS